MNSEFKENSFWGRASSLIVVFLVLAAIMISSAIFELTQSKSEQLSLMQENAHSLLESILAASNNSLLASEEIENSFKSRLFKSGKVIKEIYDGNKLSNRFLEKFCQQNDIYRINVYDQQGRRIFYNHKQEHFDLPERFSPIDALQPIFDGSSDSLVFGVRHARFEKGYRYAIAIAAKNRNAIVLNTDAASIISFRQKIGFGILLRKVSNNQGIIYLALQDSLNIIAAAGNVENLESINESQFLKDALEKSAFKTREINFDTLNVFEAVHPFLYHDKVVGLFRLGLSMEPIRAINERVYRRLIVITVFLIVLGTIFLTIYFTRQRYHLLRKQYNVVETYSGNVIENVSDAIIVTRMNKGIDIFNAAAEKLFNRKKDQVAGKEMTELFTQPECNSIIEMSGSIQQFECTLDKKKKILLISKSVLQGDEGFSGMVYVVRDLTLQKTLEDQVKRTERLTAMGELASGVAHEIRNPLNTIGTIAQQLDKDFEPGHDQEEFHELAQLVFSEVKRINETVQDFLRFARPEPVQPQWFSLSELLHQLQKQYASVLNQQNIKLVVNNDWSGKVFWDERQVKQVLINVVQNAIDAIESQGKITININPLNDQELEIIISDDGPGMKSDLKEHIFNLYFTTKARGTGIGLSIVQRIIFEHGGTIHVDSEEGKGSSFIIRLPVNSKR